MENVDRPIKDSDPVETFYYRLPSRARHIIMNEKVRTAGDLRGMDDAKILGFANSGRKTLHDIRSLLGQWRGTELNLRAAVKEMDGLTDEQRMSVLSRYCRSCGAKDPSCQCWNDE